MPETFDRDLLILLHDVARTMRVRFDQKARASNAMTRAQWVILSRLARQPGMSQNELAMVCEVEPITVGRLIDRLEERGMVERRADPNDRRIRRLHLLPAAKPVLEMIGEAKDAMSERITAGLDKPTLDTLIDALLAIKENLAHEPADPALVAAGE
jgi:MarR family transcriptional regulator, transcriptional regulator for hemolysin